MKKKWINRKELTLSREQLYNLSKKHNISKELVAILSKRDIHDIDNYLFPSSAYIHDPRLLKDAEKGASIILNHIKHGNKICIVNDYDVDGVTSGTEAREMIYYMGGEVIVITPDRNIDGYGISNRIVNEAHEAGCQLIVTTDNGIAAVEQIQLARDYGMDVVITDHHEIPYKENENGKEYIIPNANAIINPKQPDCSYPYKEICGASVICKVAEILFDMGEISDERLQQITFQKFSDNYQKKRFLLRRFLELVAIGTVCDVMPLENENRMYVKSGLSLIANSSYVGLRELISVQGIDRNKLSCYHIGFTIGPCINADGRMTGNVCEAMDLLMEKDQNKARKLAEQLKIKNDKRKEECVNGVDMAFEIIKNGHFVNDSIYFIYLPNVNPSICGIIAGKIKEGTGHPAIVCSDSSDGCIKGSGRGIKDINLFESLNKYRELFEKFGGHELACGLTITKENFTRLRELVNADLAYLETDIFIPTQYVDLYMSMDYVTQELVKDIEKMEPTGNSNPKPVFVHNNIHVNKIERFGKEQNYLRFYLSSLHGRITAISFNCPENFENYISEYFGADELEKLYQGSSCNVFLDIQYTPQLNTWNGTTTLQFLINDYKATTNI